MKKNLVRGISVAAVAAVAITMTSTDVFAKKGSAPVKENVTASQSTDRKAVKDDLVYVFTDSEGNVKNEIESLWKKEDGKDSYVTKESAYVPVGLNIEYKLDGKKVSASELQGKSGVLEIKYSYTNKTESPFAAATLMVLDNETFSDVKCEGGKLLNDGDRTIVIGMGVMLKDSEKLSNLVELKNEFTISAKVTDLVLPESYTYVGNEVFANMSELPIPDTSEYKGKITELLDAYDKISAGSKELMNGAKILDDSSAALKDGCENLGNGIGQLGDGLGNASAGAARLKVGMDTFDSSMSALSGKSEALVAGSTQVFNGLLANTYNTLISRGLQIPELTIENYAAVLEGAARQLTAYGMTDAAAAVTGAKQSLDSYDQYYQGVIAYTNGVDALSAASSTINASQGALCDGLTQLEQGSYALKAGSDKLSGGINEYTNGVSSLYKGTVDLNAGIDKYYEEGLKKLADSLSDLTGNLKTFLEENEGAAVSYKESNPYRFIIKTDGIR